MEEKKKFRLVNYIWIIPLIIGIVILSIGISKVKAANNMYVPEMGDDGWFDASVNQSDAEFAGISTCIAGGMLAFMGTIICFVIPRAVSASKKHLKSIGSYLDKNIVQPAKESIDVSHEKLKECKYCGSLAKLDATECESCGGKEFKKHKL